jgi:hypothetical protein
MLLTINEATQACITFLKNLTIEINSSVPQYISIEDFSLSEDSQSWHITLGYYPPYSFVNDDGKWNDPREYKEFEVDSSSGNVLSMKFRKV